MCTLNIACMLFPDLLYYGNKSSFQKVWYFGIENILGVTSGIFLTAILNITVPKQGCI